MKFPDGRLAVCEKCKKNFKTRDMCRVRSGHTSPPWSVAYICITIDDSCTDENGAFIDKPMTVRMVQWQPYCVKKPFGVKTPVCASCKRTNRTRSFCRERHKHRQLPWCTVYVLLSAVDATDPSTIVAGASKRVDGDTDGGKEKEKVKQEDDRLNSLTNSLPTQERFGLPPPKSEENDTEEEGDDINDIPESRTFLAKVSCRNITIHWLELADLETNDQTAFHSSIPPEVQYPGIPPQPGLDPTMAPHHYYPPPYTAQQHQEHLKSRQQYFFAMQQQQHHAYAAAPMQPWHGHPAYGGHPPPQLAAQPSPPPQPQLQLTGPVDGSHQHPPPGTTAGEAAAAQQRRGDDGSQQQLSAPYPQTHPPPPPHPWHMYYPSYALPPPEATAGVQTPALQVAVSQETEDNEGGNDKTTNGIEDHEQQDRKRPRI